MVEREKRDNRPVLLRFGVALALTLGGILYSVLSTRRIKPSGPSPSPPSQPPSDCSNQVDSEKMDTGGGKAGVKNDYHSLQTTSSSCNTVEIVPEKHEESCLPKVAIENTISALSPRSRCNEDKDGCLFPEFNELVEEFDLATAKDGFTPGKDIETTEPDVEMPRAFILCRK
ncbi:hypothetical protein F0562_024756 [Nyssa sinensis]|uniref:Uncharacterized protein n=1 Tax=Nyssa sinensis TaxID=561372 RepID=A0A5J5BAW7_9ASTE|nr:hypothetical protein F0562_024756 [Nyssa sinensis]